MSKIKLKTDGDRYNQLIEKKEKQLADLVALDEHEKQASKECSQAFQRYMDATRENTAYAKQRLADETGRTFIAIVAELIHDNIDVLDGMDINSKQVFLALNEALPDDIFVDTNMGDLNAVLHVHGGSRNMLVRKELERIDYGTHILCCGKQDHFISKERFIADYENGKYGNAAR